MQEGFYYHIYNRGINRALIFFENKNYNFFLKQFDKYSSNYAGMLAYCLMPNHFHLLVKIFESNDLQNENIQEIFPKKLTAVEKAFKDFFTSYAKAINNAYIRTGALLQAKYKRKLILDDNYLNRLIAYIHLNPVRAKICTKPEDYKFSSYNSIISNKRTKINREEVLKFFGSKQEFINFHKYYQEYQRERDYLFKPSR